MTDTPTPTGGIGHGSTNRPREVRTVADLHTERDDARGRQYSGTGMYGAYWTGYADALTIALKVIAEQS